MTKYVRPQTSSRREGASLWGVTDLRRRPATATAGAGGQAIYAIEVFENSTPCFTGDGVFEWEIPEDLDGSVLAKVETYVTTASSSGSVQVQVRNETTGNDMLSTKATIDVGYLNSKDSATPPVVNPTYQTVAWGDHLNIDVDAAGTGSTGLGIILYFTPAASLALAIAGAKGDPGGITSWQGQWSSSTTYTTNQAVSNNGSSYVAIASSTNVQPGVTSGWQTYWMLLAGNQQYTTVATNIYNGSFPIDIGMKAIFDVPFAATIVAARLLGDRVGSASVDIKKSSYAGWPSPSSIVGSSPPTITSSSKAEDTALSGWTTSITAGDILTVTVLSNDVIRILTMTLKLQRI